MRDEKLQELIACSIEHVEARKREHKALADAEQIEFDSLMASALAERLADIVEMPKALIAYCAPSRGPNPYCRDRAQDIEALKSGWRPIHFTVNAPGLAEMRFDIGQEWLEINGENHLGWRVRAITVHNGSASFYRDWFSAIAEASDVHRQTEEWRRERDKASQSKPVAQEQPATDAERLVALIEEIVVRKVGDLMEV